MARGIIFADKVNTVTERYATEIRTPEFGERLDSFLRDRGEDLHGILNGIDNDLYDPATGAGTGFSFGAYDSLDFMGAITRAFELYRRPDEFGDLVRRCMREDFSWRPLAQE